MPRQWDQLSEGEKAALRNLVERGSSIGDAAAMKSLMGHGLVEARPGGWRISPDGKRVYDEWVMTEMAARRARERELRGR